MSERSAILQGRLQRETTEEFKVKILPISWLRKAKEELIGFSDTLTAFEKKTYIDGCMLELPELSFQPNSIIVIAAPMSMKIAVFSYKGKCVTDVFRAREISIDDYLEDRFGKQGYHLLNARTLPQKLLAVRSGLAEYGKNNLVYIKGWGSFIQLETYLSDVMPDEDLSWGELANMEHCLRCGVCARLCPGGAIGNGRFLLDIERCHGWLDVIGQLPEDAPHTIAPCLVCQKSCPQNSGWRTQAETVEFSEEETGQLLTIHGIPENAFALSKEDVKKLLSDQGFSRELTEKVLKLNIYPWNLKDIPGKLRHMLAHSAV